FERPVHIVKKFNKQMFWGLPLTTKGSAGPFLHKVSNELDSLVILSQIKTVSTKRLLRKMGSISEQDFIEIRTKIRNFLEIENPRNGGFLGGRSH
ncbi:MAG: type II toxin-antitoxin system PemK/MazF family toxin, partial [Candidatus Taylorbacteria bacterium]|nr:type II toxin-antitoxin system PemK/MazF family toxin [Candidatus Taylorbacteria bacterium]